MMSQKAGYALSVKYRATLHSCYSTVGDRNIVCRAAVSIPNGTLQSKLRHG